MMRVTGGSASDESIYCAGKSPSQIDGIVARGIESNRPLLLTRLDAGAFDTLAAAHRAALDYDAISRTALLGTTAVEPRPARVAVVTAGTSDVPVAKETVRTPVVLRRDGSGDLRCGRRGTVATARSDR